MEITVLVTVEDHAVLNAQAVQILVLVDVQAVKVDVQDAEVHVEAAVVVAVVLHVQDVLAVLHAQDVQAVVVLVEDAVLAVVDVDQTVQDVEAVML